MMHELKCWPEFFEEILAGRKTFELRQDDRGFRAGDTLRLREWHPGRKEYTGRELEREVSYLMAGGGFGLLQGWVCMALESPEVAALRVERDRAEERAFRAAAKVAYDYGANLCERAMRNTRDGSDARQRQEAAQAIQGALEQLADDPEGRRSYMALAAAPPASSGEGRQG